jgi:hypothetical protein
MPMWISHQSLSFVLLFTAGLRLLQQGAASLVSPASLRRARSGAVRLITFVAGH